jgi:hypothetical protein
MLVRSVLVIYHLPFQVLQCSKLRVKAVEHQFLPFNGWGKAHTGNGVHKAGRFAEIISLSIRVNKTFSLGGASSHACRYSSTFTLRSCAMIISICLITPALSGKLFLILSKNSVLTWFCFAGSYVMAAPVKMALKIFVVDVVEVRLITFALSVSNSSRCVHMRHCLEERSKGFKSVPVALQLPGR